MIAILLFSILSILFWIVFKTDEVNLFGAGVFALVCFIGLMISVGAILSDELLHYYILGILFGAAITIAIKIKGE